MSLVVNLDGHLNINIADKNNKYDWSNDPL